MAKKTGQHAESTEKLSLTFDDNRLLPGLYGVHNAHLSYIETLLHVTLKAKGNFIYIEGEQKNTHDARQLLMSLYDMVRRHKYINEMDIKSCHSLLNTPTNLFGDVANIIQIGHKRVVPRTHMQAVYLQNMRASDLCFGIGPAGTGKTYLATCFGASLLANGMVERMIITRPAVEAGERLGFLPGDLNEKLDPYIRPIYDALHDMMPASDIHKKREAGIIEIAPLAYMRGRSLKNAFILLDEAQNTTLMQMKMFLTRLGENSRMIVNGDISQIDLPKASPSGQMVSGLVQAEKLLQNVEDISFTYFSSHDVIRYKLVQKIIEAYESE